MAGGVAVSSWRVVGRQGVRAMVQMFAYHHSPMLRQSPLQDTLDPAYAAHHGRAGAGPRLA